MEYQQVTDSAVDNKTETLVEPETTPELTGTIFSFPAPVFKPRLSVCAIGSWDGKKYLSGGYLPHSPPRVVSP